MINKNDLLLYAVTDRSWLNGMPLSDAVYKALEGGVTLLQLREKNMSYDEFVRSAIQIKQICQKFDVPLIINDNIDVCIKSNADGVHLGQNDMPANIARQILGPDKIIGVTAKTTQQAIKAQNMNADYIGSGAVFGTNTKQDAKKMDIDTLKSISSSVSIPVVAIGGISSSNIDKLQGTGIAGAAVVSGIFAQHDIKEAAYELKRKLLYITR